MPIDPEPAQADEANTPMLFRAHGYWDEKRGDGRMPSRRDIDPAEIQDLLPYTILIDVVRPQLRLYVRLVGTEICKRFGGDYTGKYLDEIDFGDVTDKILHDYAYAASKTEPYFSAHRFRKLNMNLYVDIQRGIFPLSSDGLVADKLWAVLDFAHVDKRWVNDTRLRNRLNGLELGQSQNV